MCILLCAIGEATESFFALSCAGCDVCMYHAVLHVLLPAPCGFTRVVGLCLGPCGFTRVVDLCICGFTRVVGFVLRTMWFHTC